jgi:flagellar basal body-associated protein FliL
MHFVCPANSTHCLASINVNVYKVLIRKWHSNLLDKEATKRRYSKYHIRLQHTSNKAKQTIRQYLSLLECSPRPYAAV